MMQVKAAQCPAGDEVWEASSSCSEGASSSEYESEPEVQRGKVPPLKAAPPALKTGAAPRLQLSSPPPAVKSAAPVAVSSPQAAKGGLMALVQHLSSDNARLREALISTQQEVEDLMRRGHEGPGLDHLLALVKEFGEDSIDNCKEVPFSDTRNANVEVFSIYSPRDTSESDEVTSLRAELDDAHLQIAELRAALRAREVEITQLKSGSKGVQ